jgi:threonine dehydrogenase-like Zn-dependent dehydrogenase
MSLDLRLRIGRIMPFGLAGSDSFWYAASEPSYLMRQAILYGAGDLWLEERPLDVDGLRRDQAFVETEVTALSMGTDLGNYPSDSTHVPGGPPHPRRVGYSKVGIMRHVVADFQGVRPGERVFSLKPHQWAYIEGPRDSLVKVPRTAPAEQALLWYLMQLGLAGLRYARYETGENILTVGLGVIGLCMAALGRAIGTRVAAIAGFHSGRGHCDSNSWDVCRRPMRLVRYGGRVSVLGSPGRRILLRTSTRWIRAGCTPNSSPFSELVRLLRPTAFPEKVRVNLRRNSEYILDLMANLMAIEPLISHRRPANRTAEAYELAKQGSKDLLATIFNWR